MSNISAKTIVVSDRFTHLLKTRNLIRSTLTVLVLASHAFFVGGIVFYSKWFAEPISETSTIPKGIIYTILVIVSMVLLEYIYILLSDKVIDPLQDEVVAEANKNE